MNVVLFGATGRTGVCVVEQALAKGINLTVYVRDASKITAHAPNLRIVTGGFDDYQAIENVIRGQDAVLMSLGTGQIVTGEEQIDHSILSAATQVIVKAMAATGVKRVICVLSGWIFYTNYPPQFRGVTEQHHMQLEMLKTSDLEWTAVCPPAVTDGPLTGQYRIKVEGMPTMDYMELSKNDIAHFMLVALESHDYIGKAVGIGY